MPEAPLIMQMRVQLCRYLRLQNVLRHLASGLGAKAVVPSCLGQHLPAHLLHQLFPLLPGSACDVQMFRRHPIE